MSKKFQIIALIIVAIIALIVYGVVGGSGQSAPNQDSTSQQN